MNRNPPERLILSLPDDELEKFTRKWALQKKGYFEVERSSGAGDMGRDVVGYLTKARHEGDWDNYQCKQYGKPVPLGTGLLELGKILYFASIGKFTAPVKYYFVAPKGVQRTLRDLISKPSELKQALIVGWGKYCSTAITKKTKIALTPELKQFIEAWDFSRVTVLSIDAILDDVASKAVMAEWFGKDPGPAPRGAAPSEIEQREMPYIQALVEAYGERDGLPYAGHAAVKTHADHGPHLDVQRERFFDADAFSRFYRDNTMSEEIEVLRTDMLHGVFDVHRIPHADSLARADAVLAQAANVQPSGVLSRHARVPVKQGICHHFVNEGRLTWRKK
ncbi:restriction endonuclease [Bradyrhizobium sp. 41S5]|uniref:ABC-three component system protein n=1 Tax=Bradyrhizobium sp. 41S5 TaxID=1404443 RepID=UPI00156AA19F|nr:ABC-three component system protein [Bradyrhizobium sp. 41S5]UFX46953.1 restriction endonuclease [Bradyrhizobium sp. 41S5]